MSFWGRNFENVFYEGVNMSSFEGAISKMSFLKMYFLSKQFSKFIIHYLRQQFWIFFFFFWEREREQFCKNVFFELTIWKMHFLTEQAWRKCIFQEKNSEKSFFEAAILKMYILREQFWNKIYLKEILKKLKKKRFQKRNFWKKKI